MINQIDRVVRFIALWFGGIFLLALTLVTVIDGTMRTVFTAPILGGRDIAQFYLIFVVAASIAYSGRSGGQVVVELFGAAGDKITRWTDIAMKLIGFVMLLVLSWHLSVSGLEALEFGEASGTLQISYGPFMHISAIGILLYAIVLLVEIIQLMRYQSIEYEGE